MSALPPKADIDPQSLNVRFVPLADITLLSFRDVSRRPGWLAAGAEFILLRLP